ncbi:MAG: HEPN domain-containing protein [Deltaproteobacteria bacterium]|nr:HEPN domain-containing protein [Deltaproteobacteria bacterium]
MTDDNVRRNVQDELRLAESALAAATALVELGLAPDAASRAYYAALHAARALLFSIGLDPGSHRAVRNLVSRHFVQSGDLAPEHSKGLAQLEALRSAGDYDSAFALGPDQIRPEVDKARTFVEAAREILRRSGIAP